MIYNTAIGMFYALGTRVTSSRPGWYVPVFLGLCAAGYGVSFVGFDTLMTYVYPVLGYLGLAMVVLLVGWWILSRTRLSEESETRDTVRDLAEKREDGDGDLNAEEEAALDRALDESDADNDKLEEQVVQEATGRDGDPQ